MQVYSLQHILAILRAAPKRRRGDCEWTPVKLTWLSLRDNSQQSKNDRQWACVQVAALIIDNQTYSLSAASLDAHITLGYWQRNQNRNPTSWLRFFNRGRFKLAKVPSLDMELMLKTRASDDTLLVFTFMVHSAGGSTIQCLSQTLDACDFQRLENPARSMSPPGLLFHLSVYETTR